MYIDIGDRFSNFVTNIQNCHENQFLSTAMEQIRLWFELQTIYID